jgi:predicted DNA-binding protein (MmcQ/YjbR family)
MNRQDVFQWVKQQYGRVPDYPWMDTNAVLRHAENKKWYGLIMDVPEKRLGLPGNEEVEVLNVKCDPILMGSLRTKRGFLPAYHMNKDSWISIVLRDVELNEEIRNVIALSYEMTKPKLKEKPKTKR